MALIITVFECDGCQQVIGLKTEPDWQNFETSWWEGFYFQFCPDCFQKEETLDRRLEDTRMTLDLTNKVRSDVR